jgi:hypothetical protein
LPLAHLFSARTVTHRRAILDVEATGGSCTVDEIVIFRLTEGKIVEAWRCTTRRECGVSSAYGICHNYGWASARWPQHLAEAPRGTCMDTGCIRSPVTNSGAAV